MSLSFDLVSQCDDIGSCNDDIIGAWVPGLPLVCFMGGRGVCVGNGGTRNGNAWFVCVYEVFIVDAWVLLLVLQ